MLVFPCIKLIFKKNSSFLNSTIIWLQTPEISLKFELSSEKLFDKNQLKIDFSIAVYLF
jgi:hypothetical protein